jgi:hypothetical protein
MVRVLIADLWLNALPAPGLQGEQDRKFRVPRSGFEAASRRGLDALLAFPGMVAVGHRWSPLATVGDRWSPKKSR